MTRQDAVRLDAGRGVWPRAVTLLRHIVPAALLIPAGLGRLPAHHMAPLLLAGAEIGAGIAVLGAGLRRLIGRRGVGLDWLGIVAGVLVGVEAWGMVSHQRPFPGYGYLLVSIAIIALGVAAGRPATR